MTTRSAPTCPTCNNALSSEKAENLDYFARSGREALSPDDWINLYEDTHKVLFFLGALAQASPRAVVQYDKSSGSTAGDEWVMWLAWLAEELTEEAQRRLFRLRKAALIWEKRAETATTVVSAAVKTGKEGESTHEIS